MAGLRRATPRSTPPATGPARWASTSSGTASCRKTPEGYYQVQGGIDYAIAKSLAAAPFADLLWMETKTADLADARSFADAIHAEFPDKMLAYNLSPSFNWDTTGHERRRDAAVSRRSWASSGFVFNFITYGGHQIDGLAAEEFATALRQDGMLALARLQRKFRLVESPYRTPQTLVGGPARRRRADGLPRAARRPPRRWARARPSTSTWCRPRCRPSCWRSGWPRGPDTTGSGSRCKVSLRPHTAGSELLELGSPRRGGEKVANVIFAPIEDRRGRNILSVRDQNTFDTALRKKRLMTLIHLFLIHRYKAASVHYVSPTEDNRYQAQKMKAHGLFSDVHDEVGQIIVADVDAETDQAPVGSGPGTARRPDPPAHVAALDIRSRLCDVRLLLAIDQHDVRILLNAGRTGYPCHPARRRSCEPSSQA